MALTYGTEGIKPKDYRVYIDSATAAGVVAAVAAYVATPTKALLATLIAALDELGECRADSIDLGIADGDSVEGNVLGKIVLGKTGTFTVELLNATPTNIAALELLDGVACTIVLNERDTHGTAPGFKTAVVLNNVVVSYSEKITGSDSIRATISVEKSTPTASSFRHIADNDQT